MEMTFAIYLWADGPGFDAHSAQAVLPAASKGKVVETKWRRKDGTLDLRLVWYSEERQNQDGDPIEIAVDFASANAKIVYTLKEYGAARVAAQVAATYNRAADANGFYLPGSAIKRLSDLGLALDIAIAFRSDE